MEMTAGPSGSDLREIFPNESIMSMKGWPISLASVRRTPKILVESPTYDTAEENPEKVMNMAASEGTAESSLYSVFCGKAALPSFFSPFPE